MTVFAVDPVSAVWNVGPSPTQNETRSVTYAPKDLLSNRKPHRFQPFAASDRQFSLPSLL